MDAIHLPIAITPATPFAASPTPFQPGQVIQALVLDLIENDLFRLQLPQAVIDIRTTAALAIGSTITLAVKSTGANPKLAIYAGNVPAQSLSTRDPIGEAVVVARAAPNAANAPNTANGSNAPAETQVVRDAPSVSPARPPVPPAATPPTQLTPELALGEAVRVAAVRQTGAAPLFADVEQIAQSGADAVPAPVREAAAQLVALRVPLTETLTAADVKQAFVRSGVLLEPQLATQADASGRPSAETPAAALPPGGDLKAALLVLRQVLQAWSGEAAPSRLASQVAAAPTATPDRAETAPTARPSLPLADSTLMKSLGAALLHTIEDTVPHGSPLTAEQVTDLAKVVAAQLGGREAPMPENPAAVAQSPGGPPPPYRGAPLSGQQPVAAAINLDAPAHESAERLLAATDGAIARTTLLQAASLPDKPLSHTDQPTQRWTFEVPFATAQGTNIAQFEVSRDPRAAESNRQLPTWRARFTLDLEPMGPVHALIGLAGARTSVTLWAERQATAQQLSDNAKMLGEGLRAAELEPVEFQFRVGAPPKLAQSVKPGSFMDRAT